jgi:hypothetical protein
MLIALGILDAHFARLQRRQQRRVPRCDTDLTHLRRRKYHYGFAGVNLAFRGYDVYLNCWHDLSLIAA